METPTRLFNRDKAYALLKLAGLALGSACFALLMMWVWDEVGWDRFHENAPLIYRLESNSPAQPAPLVPHLKANYPEIMEGVRFFFSSPLVVRYGYKVFDEGSFVLTESAPKFRPPICHLGRIQDSRPFPGRIRNPLGQP